MPVNRLSPGCGCCDQSCLCPDGSTENSTYAGAGQSFSLKVIVSNLPSTVTFNVLNTIGTSNEDYGTYQIDDLDTMNGTYFLPLPKTASGCLDFTTGLGKTSIATQTLTVTEDYYSLGLGDACGSNNISGIFTIDFTLYGELFTTLNASLGASSPWARNMVNGSTGTRGTISGGAPLTCDTDGWLNRSLSSYKEKIFANMFDLAPDPFCGLSLSTGSPVARQVSVGDIVASLEVV